MWPSAAIHNIMAQFLTEAVNSSKCLPARFSNEITLNAVTVAVTQCVNHLANVKFTKTNKTMLLYCILLRPVRGLLLFCY